MGMIAVHLDMETQDPDDAYTLCFVATHPQIDLKSVSVFPGGLDQVGVVKHILGRLGRDIPVAADPKDPDKSRVSGYHYKWLGKVEPRDPDCSIQEVFRGLDPSTTLLTGAPLTNVLRGFQARLGPFFKRWVCQGGFAGDNVVSSANRLPKFEGRQTCPTFNLNGNPKAALELLASDRFGSIDMVSKNVCHGAFFGPEELRRLPRGRHAGLDLLIEGVEVYLKDHPSGKALHDLVAAAALLDPGIATWCKGKAYRSKGEWGFQPFNSSCRITIALDREKLLEVVGG